MIFSTSTASISSLLVLISSLTASAYAAEPSKPATKPCTIYSPSSGSFHDLRPLQLYPSNLADVPSSATLSNESYHARGYDYPYNFTLNFCGPVVESLANLTDGDGVDGLSKRMWANVSAYYKDKSGDVFSIGSANDMPTFRGKKLLLNYTNGSPCPELDEDGEPIEKREIIGGGDDDDDGDDEDEPPKRKPASGSKPKAVTRRKGTMLYFACDTSPALSSRPAITFLGTLDHCTYNFEVRSRWACGGVTTSEESGTLGPGGVFAVILAIAVAVYVIGGVVYQRNVMHQRGWRQLPNYGVWAGLFGFFSDMFIIVFSSCSRCMPSLGRLFNGKHGYHRVGQDYRGNGSIGGNGGRGRTSEDANRLIDSLDEEWD